MIAQTRLLETYHTSQGLNFLEGMFDDMNAKHKPEHRRDPRALQAIHVKTLIDAEPVWISQEATQIIDHARESFEPEIVLPNDPFVASGFALFSQAIILNDAPRTKLHPGRSIVGLPIKAIAWMPIHTDELDSGCFWISYFIHIEDEIILGDDRWSPPEAEAMRKWMPLSLVHMWQWTWDDNPFDGTLEIATPEGDDMEEVIKRARQQQQLIQATWRIGSQFMPVKAAPIRQIRRDARRKGLTRHSDVNIITLRRAREYDAPEEESGRHLHVQFPVHGYWARRHTRDGVRQVWVRPHLKGPPDAPLVVKKRAWEFRR